VGDYKTQIKAKFDEVKRKDPRDPLIELPVFNDDSQIIAYLKPITKDYRETLPGVVELLGKWRAENPTLSDSVFEITNARTEKWLDKLIIGRDDRLLFLIDDFSNNHLGHIAYSSFDYSAQTAEIDCVLRGVKNVIPGLMSFCVKALVNWGFAVLQLNEIFLSTSKNNSRAIALYEKCGFKIIHEIPLIRKELQDEVRWDPAGEGFNGVAERYSVKMQYFGEKNAK